jgi:hypothetical protein
MACSDHRKKTTTGASPRAAGWAIADLISNKAPQI